MRLHLTIALAAMLVLPAAAQDDPVVALVDGEAITMSDIERARGDLPEQYHQMPMDVLFSSLRDRAIDTALLYGEADRRELATDPVVVAALAEAQRFILRNRLIETTVADAVTDEAVAAAYAERQNDSAFSYDEVKARHILVTNEEEAAALIAEAEAGADFATLAQEHSTGPSAADGGDLGWFQHEQMVGPFADAAFAMQAGEVTAAPVETRFGWHVILVEDRRTVTPDLEDVRAEIEQELGRDAVEGLLVELRAEADIERFDPEGNPEVPAE